MTVVTVGLVLLSLAQAWLIFSMREGQRLRDRIAETRERLWAQERKDLLDRIMYLADKPWESPPLPTPVVEDETLYVDDALDEPLPMIMDYGDFAPVERV